MAGIKTDIADTRFSQWVRLRDKRCVRCGSDVRYNAKGFPISHTNSHFFGRGAFNTRFSPENCDTLCYACHVLWGSRDREEYRQFKINQLGQDNYDILLLASNTYRKKDFPMERIYWKQKLMEDFGL